MSVCSTVFARSSAVKSSGRESINGCSGRAAVRRRSAHTPPPGRPYRPYYRRREWPHQRISAVLTPSPRPIHQTNPMRVSPSIVTLLHEPFSKRSIELFTSSLTTNRLAIAPDGNRSQFISQLSPLRCNDGCGKFTAQSAMFLGSTMTSFDTKTRLT